jgi:uncharacterized protein YdaU (DUF1376 family)
VSNNLYLPFHPGDYLTDTAHLSAAEHGAYLLLILNYWQRGEPLPADDKKLRGISRLSPAEWAESRDTLMEFFTERDGLLYHKRIEEELERAREKTNKARESGKRGADAKRTLSERSADAKRTLSERPANQDQVQEQDRKEEADASSSAPARGKSTLEAECRQLVGEEPVLLALDFHVIEQLVEAGDVTKADVLAGIRAALAKPNFRIRVWSQLAGWARGAAKERLAAKPKAGVPIVVAMRPEERDAALAQTGKRWVAYDTAEWVRVADLWKAERGTYPPHPAGGWYFEERFFAKEEAAA